MLLNLTNLGRTGYVKVFRYSLLETIPNIFNWLLKYVHYEAFMVNVLKKYIEAL